MSLAVAGVQNPNAVEDNDDENHRDNDGEVVVDSDDDGEIPTGPVRFKFSWRKLWKFMGPGWLMSLAYLDPGNLESDLQQGAYTGFTIVWVLWWATVMGLILQELSARLGVVTGMDLAQNIRKHFPRWLTWVVYVNMEAAVVAADIQEVVGSGIAIYILTNGRVAVWIGCIITGVDTFTFLAVHYLGVRYLEMLICGLISTMTVCFFYNWAESGTDGGALAYGWAIPSIKAYAVTQAVGTIGAVIMPHNLYLHSGLVQSRKVNRRNPHKVNDAIKYNLIESSLALLTSFFINLAIVATNSANFYNPTCAEISSGGPLACLSPKALAAGDEAVQTCTLGNGGSGVCAEIGLEKEGIALAHGLGNYAMYIWALGLLAAGQASTMTCTYAGQVIMGGCLRIQLAPWKRVAFTRALALGPSIAVAAATVGNSELFNNINEYLNILQSVQLPFAMLPVLHLSSRPDIMGRFASKPAVKVFNSVLAVIVMVTNVYLVITFVQEFSPVGIVLSCLYGCLYAFFCFRMIWEDIKAMISKVTGSPLPPRTSEMSASLRA